VIQFLAPGNVAGVAVFSALCSSRLVNYFSCILRIITGIMPVRLRVSLAERLKASNKLLYRNVSRKLYSHLNVPLYRTIYPFKDEAQTVLFKDSVRTAL